MDKKIATYANTSDFYVRPEEGIKLVLDGNYAYHCEASTAYYFVKKFFLPSEICELQETNLRKKLNLCVLTKRQSPYKEVQTIK